VTHRSMILWPSSTVAVVAVGLWLTSLLAAAPKDPSATGSVAQPQQGGATEWVAPRTAWGHPDLQGIWDTASGIPLERPKDLGTKTVLSAAESAARREQAAKRQRELENTNAALHQSKFDASTLTPTQLAGIVGPSADFSPGLPENRGASDRTSLIVDPPDGRIPPLTPEARQRLEQREAARSHRGEGDSWQDRNSWERCITRTLPLAMLSTYNSNYQILQTPEYVAIVVEMIHEARIIPLDDRPRLGQGIRQWLGDSRGHWEGDTLVVETRNFVDKLDGGSVMPSHPNIVFTHRGSGDTLRLIERFRRVNEHTIDYQFTLNDPKTYTKPWTASVPMRNDGTPPRIFEYACHEGNAAMDHLLKAARANEAGALDAARSEARERIEAGQPGVGLR
jgi:hypothetical protein